MGIGKADRSTELCLSATQKFYTQASDLLLAQSPAISSLLGAKFIQGQAVISGRSTQSQSRLCQSCGTVLIPGRSCRRQHNESSRVQGSHSTRRRPTIRSHRQRDVYRCDKCDCRNVSSLPKIATQPVSKQIKKPQQQDEHVLQKAEHPGKPQRSPAEAATIPKSSSKGQEPPATSAPKKRSRGRKQEGLQAMLSKAKQEPSNPGLSLMDFMSNT